MFLFCEICFLFRQIFTFGVYVQQFESLFLMTKLEKKMIINFKNIHWL